MVWVQYKEKYHGRVSRVWKKKSSVASARREVKGWNRFSNPSEHLSIERVSSKKPKGIRKTRYKGIYK